LNYSDFLSLLILAGDWLTCHSQAIKPTDLAEDNIFDSKKQVVTRRLKKIFTEELGSLYPSADMSRKLNEVE
jgi:hypothetical protein